MLLREMLEDIYNATSLLASEAGVRLSDLLIGTAIARPGQDHVLASRLVSLAKEKAPVTYGICGQSSCDSSPSVALQQSLESKLRERMDVNGSPEYDLTWKHWDMESGPPICALRASARRIPVSVCIGELTGWPTPDTNKRGGAQDPAKRKAGGHSVNLQDVAMLSGWPTCSARDWKNGQSNQHGKNARPLNEVAMLAGWGTPAAQEAGGTPEQFLARKQKAKENGAQLGASLTSLSLQAHGVIMKSSPAQTEKRGALNPEHSRWLMGFPTEWLSCADLAMLSCRKSRRNSSKHS